MSGRKTFRQLNPVKKSIKMKRAVKMDKELERDDSTVSHNEPGVYIAVAHDKSFRTNKNSSSYGLSPNNNSDFDSLGETRTESKRLSFQGPDKNLAFENNTEKPPKQGCIIKVAAASVCLLVVVAVAAILLMTIAVPQIAQGIVDNSKLTFSSMTLSKPDGASVQLQASGQLEGIPFDAVLKPMEVIKLSLAKYTVPSPDSPLSPHQRLPCITRRKLLAPLTWPSKISWPGRKTR